MLTSLIVATGALAICGAIVVLEELPALLARVQAPRRAMRARNSAGRPPSPQ